MKKICVFLSAILLITVFAGCGRSDNGMAKKVEKAEIFDSAEVCLTENGKIKYTLVKSENASLEVSNAVSDLFKKFKKQFGYSHAVITDKTDDTDDYEILVGRMVRKASVDSYDYLRDNGGLYKDDYLIMSTGKKIVIIGVDDTSTAEAVKYFCENYVTDDVHEKGIFYRKYSTLPAVKSPTVNGVPIVKFALVRPHFNTSYVTQLEIDKLSGYISETTGCILEEVEDTYIDEQTYEIIVGNSDRNGVEKLTDRDSFSVRIEGSKVYLNGGHNYSTAAAVTEFLNLIKKGNVTDSDSILNGDYDTAIKKYDLAEYFTPSWSDDFDGDGIDMKNWRVINGAAEKGVDRPTVRSADPSVTGVENGLFYIKPKMDDNYYYGGKIQTDYSMSFLYGFVEISKKIPDKQGMWSAFWTGSNDSKNTMYLSPGVDITESFGDGHLTTVSCHVWPKDSSPLRNGRRVPHYMFDKLSWGTRSVYCPDGRSFHDDFHTFGMLWTPTELTFTCDGKEYLKYRTDENDNDHEAYTDHTMYLKLSMIVGTPTYGSDIVRLTEDDWNSDERCLYADHVYLYQLKDGKSKVNIKNSYFH